MGKLSFLKDPSRTAINNSPEKAVGISLGLEDITKAEPFASLFDIRGETLEAIKADMEVNGFDPSKPVNVWKTAEGKRILIDGYTRVKAAEALGLLSITAYEKTFKDEAEALAYAIHTQKDRRNLSGAEILRLVELIDEPVKGFKGPRAPDEEKPIGTASAPIVPRGANGEGPMKTAEKTAEALGVSPRTIERARVVLKDPKKRAAVLSGKQSIAKAAQAKSSPPSGARKPSPPTKKPEARDPAAEALASLLSASDLHKLERLAQAEGTTPAALARGQRGEGMTRDRLRAKLEEAKADARRVYEANKAAGSSSTAYDSGRYDGLKQAIEILDSLEEEGPKA
jgi:ParB family chromosome partitioning protein